MAKAGAERATPLATATLIVAANAPDVDVLSFVRGEYFALSFRRGITHGWPAMAVLPFAVTAAMLAWDRWVRRRRRPDAEPADARWLLILSAAALLTHPALDWMNIYGMRWWLPFDGSWSYGDSLFIIDPWIWLGLGGSVYLSSSPGRLGRAGWIVLALATSAVVAVFAGGWITAVWLAGLAAIVALRLRPKDGGRARRTRGVRLAGSACVVYVALMTAASAVTRRDVVTTAAAAGLDVDAVLVAPAPGVPLRANVELLTDRGWMPGDHDWRNHPRLRLQPERAIPPLQAPQELAPEAVERIIEKARSEPDARHFLAWARFTYVRVAPDGETWRVHFADVRYDSDPEAGNLGGVTVHVPPQPPIIPLTTAATPSPR